MVNNPYRFLYFTVISIFTVLYQKLDGTYHLFKRTETFSIPRRIVIFYKHLHFYKRSSRWQKESSVSSAAAPFADAVQFQKVKAIINADARAKSSSYPPWEATQGNEAHGPALQHV